MVERPQQAYEVERTNLEAHVDICAERYFRMEQRLENLEKGIESLKDTMVSESKRTSKIIIGSAATVIGGVLSTMVAMLMMM